MPPCTVYKFDDLLLIENLLNMLCKGGKKNVENASLCTFFSLFFEAKFYCAYRI